MSHQVNDSQHPWVGRMLALVVAVSLAVHVVGLVLARTLLRDLRWAHDPAHAAIEVAGSLVALTTARMLITQEHVGHGTSFNNTISAALICMGVLDGLHALVHAGNAFVLLHSLATFLGGVLFSAVWLPRRWTPARLPRWTGLLTTGLGLAIIWVPGVSLPMVRDGHFTLAAVLLNGVGGALLLAATAKLLHTYRRTQNLDDALFSLHCLLFGLAATMFAESKLWDIAWWCWHFLRLFAYLTALWFLVRSQHQLERRLLQTAVAEEVQPLNAALNAVASVSQANLNGVITFANDHFAEMSGYRREELVGSTHRLLSSGQHPPEFFQAMWKTLSAGKPWQGEICNRRKTGELYWVHTWILPKRDTAGHHAGYVSIRVDITERKRLEARLVEARKTAEAALQTKSVFLANMSHEIRTPMNGILGATDLLLQAASVEEKDELARAIQRSGESLLVIINDILDYSKMESGRLTLESVPVDLPRLVREAVQVFEGEAKDKQLELRVELQDGLPAGIVGDPTRLRQVLLNLLSNAVKFTDSGHVTTRLSMSETADGWTLRLSVTDTGIGMTEKELARIFQRFAQADSSTTRTHGGTGLGTSISQGLVELMGGELRVRSLVGEGTTFTAELPVRLCDLRSLLAPRPDTPRTQFAGRVLLVEDNPVNQMIGTKTLRNLGLEVELARNGAEALQCVESVAPDLILMDIQMPVMDGLEATRRLHEAGCEIPIVAMTANVMQDNIEACAAEGMAGYVPKPFKLSELTAVLQQHLPDRSIRHSMPG